MKTIDFKQLGESIQAWREKTGLTEIENPGTDICYIVNGIDKEIKDMKLSNLELCITRIASYNIFLKSEKAKIISRISLLTEQYRRILYQETQRLETINGDFKFKKIDEKETLAILSNDSLRALKDSLLDQQIRCDQIKDLPHGIDTKLRTLEIIYKQKQRSQYGQI